MGKSAIALLSVLAAFPAAAEIGRPRAEVNTVGVNRLVNPNFDTNIDSWVDIFAASPAWDSRNVAAVPGSGSLRNNTLEAAAPSTGYASGQCVTGITPGSAIYFGGHAMLPGGQTRSPVAGFRLRFHSAAQSCYDFESVSFNNAGDSGISFIQAGSTPLDTWVELKEIVVAPPLVDKVDFQLFIGAGTGTGVAQALYDATSLTTLGFAAKSDINRDLFQDILWRNYVTGQNAVWLMNGTALASVADLPALANVNYFLEGAGDFDADGDADILWRNQMTGQNAVWRMNGVQFTGIADLPALPNTNFHFEGVGDFNLDGKPDIVIRNAVTGQNALWLLNGVALAGIVDLPALPNTNYRIEGVGDFNGDLKYDIVWRNYATGQNALWIMNGNALSAVVDLPALPNTSYRIDGVGDINNDYRPDIIWRNATTGQNAAWLMNGVSLTSIIDLPALANTAFHIAAPR